MKGYTNKIIMILLYSLKFIISWYSVSVDITEEIFNDQRLMMGPKYYNLMFCFIFLIKK